MLKHNSSYCYCLKQVAVITLIVEVAIEVVVVVVVEALTDRTPRVHLFRVFV
jgi:hypothetical protein